MPIEQISTPKVSIGIVTYNSRNHIDRCLKSLEEQTYPHIEIVILDNDSPDGTARWIAERWPQYRLIANETNVGFGCAHNQIIASTEGDYYMPMNPDVFLTSKYMDTMVRTIEEAPSIGWVSGKLLFMDENGIPSNIIFTVGHAAFADGHAINIGYHESDNGQYDLVRDVFGANAAAPLYRRAMLDEIQIDPGEFFDRSIFLYGEDVDLDWRARLLGWRCVYTPRAIAYHVHGGSGGISHFFIKKEITANRYYSILKNGFLIDVLTYNLPAFIGHSLFMLLTEPRRGMATVISVLSRVGEIAHKRRWLWPRRKMSRRELRQWFTWSMQQRGKQPVTYLGRFWRRRAVKMLFPKIDDDHLALQQ